VARVVVAPAAERDLKARHLAAARARALAALEAYAERRTGDVKPIRGMPGWLRLRIGEVRILFRLLDDTVRVERIVDRKDLERAIRQVRR
jgi:mRNA-degrading endonuclease RelE of RelBE toxin-antitoxin system